MTKVSYDIAEDLSDLARWLDHRHLLDWGKFCSVPTALLRYASCTQRGRRRSRSLLGTKLCDCSRPLRDNTYATDIGPSKVGEELLDLMYALYTPVIKE